jgi:predicted flavoprotein YhiN
MKGFCERVEALPALRRARISFCSDSLQAQRERLYMKNQYTVKVNLSEDLLRKLLYISEKEKRTPNNQFTFMLRNNIQYFEKTKGRITPNDLKAVDITPYLEEDGEKDAE